MGSRLCLIAAVALLALGAGTASAAPKLLPSEREAIRNVLVRYIPAVLERKDIPLGWKLSGPQVRGSTTLKEWLHGGVPVYPFHPRGDRIDTWTTTYVLPGDVGLDLLLQPRQGSSEPAIAFRIEMTRIGGSWKVNAFYPEALFGVDHGRVFSPQDATPNGATPMASRQRISGTWLALPAALIGAVALLGPVAWVVVSRRRERSAYREHLARVGD
jgi:hypothetical protein